MSQHPSDVASISVSDVEKVDSTGWQQLGSGKKEYLLGKSKRKINNQFTEQQSRFDTLEGDVVDATILLAAHAFEMAEGGEAQSSSSQGGNVSFNVVTGDLMSNLSETRYGRELLSDYLRGRQSLGLVRTR